jgi:poly-beta-1,6-N-acetyl-D-glucosamine N-deacetylase
MTPSFMTAVHRFARRLAAAMVAACALTGPASAAPSEDAPGTLRILCYHDVRDRLRDTQDQMPDDEAIDTRDLADHFSWLKENGYTPVSLDQVIAARNGGPPLPPRPVMLTFDDGLASLYTRVFPLLSLFGYPAVAAIETRWLEVADDATVEYGDRKLPRAAFVSWADLRRMRASGLLEVASHSHDLHRSVVANPQGGETPSAVTRRYDGSARAYETEDAYRQRIAADLKTSAEIIARRLGSAPRAMIWPYGEYNRTGVEAARAAGMPITFNLEAGPNPPGHPLERLRRTLMRHDTGIAELIGELHGTTLFDADGRGVERVVDVSLDTVFDADPARAEANLGRLLDHIADLQPSTVYLRAWSEAQQTGPTQVYFPNRRLPVRADLFSRAAWQLRTRAGVRVFAELPLSAWRWAAGTADAPAAILDLYTDLARSGRFAGLVLRDDRVPEPGRTEFAPDPTERLALDVARAVLDEQPGLGTARGVRLPAAAGVGGRLDAAMKRYDFVILGLDSDEAGKRAALNDELLDTVKSVPAGLAKAVFMVPAGEHGPAASGETMARAFARMRAAGARNFGYAGDDWRTGQPAPDAIKPVISLDSLYRTR